jgi:PAS domain-containing protein
VAAVRNAEDITPPATSPSRARDLADGLAALAPLGSEGGGDVRGWLDTPIERALTRVVLEDFAPLAVVRVDDGAAFVNKNYLKLYGLTREDERLASHRTQLADEVGAALARFRDNAPTMGAENRRRRAQARGRRRPPLPCPLPADLRRAPAAHGLRRALLRRFVGDRGARAAARRAGAVLATCSAPLPTGCGRPMPAA